MATSHLSLPRLCRRLIGAVALVVLAQPGFAETHTLSPGDTIFIRAGNWSFTDQTYQEWAGVSGEYKVGAGGAISVALAGQVEATGKTPQALSDEISAMLQRRIGLPDAPTVAIEVSQYRPVFVTGAVDRPGAHPFSAGLTVGQALALAGGPPRTYEPGQTSTKPDIELRGRLEQVRVNLDALMAQEARLVAEIASYEGQGTDESVTLSLIESQLKDANQTAVLSQQEALRELQRLLDEQIVRLDQEMQLITGQIDSTKEELERISTLQERGLVINTRVAALQTSIANMEARRLQVEVARLTAEQQRNTALREEAGILDQARLRRLTELKQTRDALAEARIRFLTTQAIHRDYMANDGGATSSLAAKEPPIYRITRTTGDSTETITVTRDTLVKPGDLLEAIQPLAAFLTE